MVRVNGIFVFTLIALEHTLRALFQKQINIVVNLLVQFVEG